MVFNENSRATLFMEELLLLNYLKKTVSALHNLTTFTLELILVHSYAASLLVNRLDS